MRPGIKLTEELVTIIALDSFTRDLYDLISSSPEHTSNDEFLSDLYNIGRQALERKIQNMPQYETLIQQFEHAHNLPSIDSDPKGYTEAEGSDN